MFSLRSSCQFFFSPSSAYFAPEILFCLNKRKVDRASNLPSSSFLKLKSCQNTPKIRSKKLKILPKIFKHITFSVWCYADDDPLNIFESLTAGTITYLSWKFSIDIRHRTRKKRILFIKSEIVEFMVNFRQVPPTCQTRTCWESPMDWMLSGIC